VDTFGGVAVPGAACAGGPGGGGANVDAEDVGQDGGGDLAGELEHRGVSRSARWDPERDHAASEVVGVDVSAGLTAGEQPPVDLGDGAGGADLASPGQLAEEAGERFGDLDVVLAEADGQVREMARTERIRDLRELAVAEIIVGWTDLDGLGRTGDGC
jgi:hypothetical protein